MSFDFNITKHPLETPTSQNMETGAKLLKASCILQLELHPIEVQIAFLLIEVI